MRIKFVSIIVLLAAQHVATWAASPTQLLAALVAVPTQYTAPGECHTSLDNSRTLYSDGDKKASYKLLKHMQAYCTDFPQIEHNLGVIAASNQQYDVAIQHFENSLQQDKRSQDTVDQLQTVRAYQASIAYSEALQLRSRASKPALTMQDSSSLNSHSPHLSRTQSDLHNISTVEYELYDWWQSARDSNKEAWLSHYEQQYPPPAGAMTAPVDWQKTQRRINFTAQDAVAIVSYRSKGLLQHRQLLMRLQGNRWKIYQEFALE